MNVRAKKVFARTPVSLAVRAVGGRPQGGGGGPSPIACNYALNLDADTLTGFGLNGRLALSDSDQTGTLTILGGRASAWTLGAGPGGFTAFPIATAGTVIGVRIITPDITNGANPAAGVSARAQFANASLTATATFNVITDAAGTRELFFSNSVTGTTQSLGAVSGDVTFYVILNRTTIRVFLNGTETVLTSASFAHTTALFVEFVEEGPGVGASHTGKTVSVGLISGGVVFPAYLPAGLSNMCGSLLVP